MTDQTQATPLTPELLEPLIDEVYQRGMDAPEAAEYIAAALRAVTETQAIPLTPEEVQEITVALMNRFHYLPDDSGDTTNPLAKSAFDKMQGVDALRAATPDPAEPLTTKDTGYVMALRDHDECCGTLRNHRATPAPDESWGRSVTESECWCGALPGQVHATDCPNRPDPAEPGLREDDLIRAGMWYDPETNESIAHGTLAEVADRIRAATPDPDEPRRLLCPDCGHHIHRPGPCGYFVGSVADGSKRPCPCALRAATPDPAEQREHDAQGRMGEHLFDESCPMCTPDPAEPEYESLADEREHMASLGDPDLMALRAATPDPAEPLALDGQKCAWPYTDCHAFAVTPDPAERPERRDEHRKTTDPTYDALLRENAQLRRRLASTYE